MNKIQENMKDSFNKVQFQFIFEVQTFVFTNYIFASILF